MIGIFLFGKFPTLKYTFIFLMVPFILLILLLPVNAYCKFDYNEKRFTSYITPIIPIPYCFNRNDIKFEDIAAFYYFRVPKCGKKHYKIGINKTDGQDADIILGQDGSCSREYDPNLIRIPYVLKRYLKR